MRSSQHPSASLKQGTTLVPETVRIVSSLLKSTSVASSDVEGLLKDIHATLLDIAVTSADIGPNLDRIGYEPAGGREINVREFVANYRGTQPLVRPSDIIARPTGRMPPTGVPAAPRGRPAKTKTTRSLDPSTSVSMDFIRCLEDGKKVRDLRRHLLEVFGMSPDEYRKKWNLPASYPMTAPSQILKRGDSYEVNVATGVLTKLRR